MGTEPSEQAETAGPQAGHSGRDQPDHQHTHHIHTGQGCAQHHQIRENLNPLDRLRLHGNLHRQAFKQINRCDSHGRRAHDHTVNLELVPHVALLRAGRGNRRVGDKRQVIAEKGAPHHNSHHQRDIQPSLLRNPCRHRNQCHDRPHRRPDSQRNKTGGNKDSRQQKAVRQDTQCQVDRRVNGPHLFGRGCERTRQHEDPDHQHDILMRRTSREPFHPLGQLHAPGNQHGIGRCRQECHRNRHFVEIPRHQRGHQIETQKNRKRTQCP